VLAILCSRLVTPISRERACHVRVPMWACGLPAFTPPPSFSLCRPRDEEHRAPPTGAGRAFTPPPSVTLGRQSIVQSTPDGSVHSPLSPRCRAQSTPTLEECTLRVRTEPAVQNNDGRTDWLA